ncbi:MAG: CocE/NonD family hydrolase, partial [Deltaproteobacteria bacterium]
ARYASALGDRIAALERKESLISELLGVYEQQLESAHLEGAAIDKALAGNEEWNVRGEQELQRRIEEDRARQASILLRRQRVERIETEWIGRRQALDVLDARMKGLKSALDKRAGAVRQSLEALDQVTPERYGDPAEYVAALNAAVAPEVTNEPDVAQKLKEKLAPAVLNEIRTRAKHVREWKAKQELREKKRAAVARTETALQEEEQRRAAQEPPAQEPPPAPERKITPASGRNREDALRRGEKAVEGVLRELKTIRKLLVEARTQDDLMQVQRFLDEQNQKFAAVSIAPPWLLTAAGQAIVALRQDISARLQGKTSSEPQGPASGDVVLPPGKEGLPRRMRETWGFFAPVVSLALQGNVEAARKLWRETASAQVGAKFASSKRVQAREGDAIQETMTWLKDLGVIVPPRRPGASSSPAAKQQRFRRTAREVSVFRPCTVVNPQGIRMRPAMNIAKFADRAATLFVIRITLKDVRRDKIYSALDLMPLAGSSIPDGAPIVIEVRGPASKGVEMASISEWMAQLLADEKGLEGKPEGLVYLAWLDNLDKGTKPARKTCKAGREATILADRLRDFGSYIHWFTNSVGHDCMSIHSPRLDGIEVAVTGPLTVFAREVFDHLYIERDERDYDRFRADERLSRKTVLLYQHYCFGLIEWMSRYPTGEFAAGIKVTPTGRSTRNVRAHEEVVLAKAGEIHALISDCYSEFMRLLGDAAAGKKERFILRETLERETDDQFFPVVRRLGKGLPVLTGDEAAFGLALYLLINNARSAMASARHKGSHDDWLLQVSADRVPSKDVVRIRLSDNGIGYTKKQIPHYFERSFLTAGLFRTGIRAYIARRIIAGFGGTVAVDSVYRKGATVTIDLPMSVDKKPGAASSPASSPATGELRKIGKNLVRKFVHGALVFLMVTIGAIFTQSPAAGAQPVVGNAASSRPVATGNDGCILPDLAGDDLKVIVERNVAVPMRDGTILRADIYRPDRGGPYPVLVQRTPYGKWGDFSRFVKAGYIVVSQDVRGRFDSEGEFDSFWKLKTHDAEDGYDTVEWAARLPGSTGKVGTFGASWPANQQWRLAPLVPPSLVAMAAFSVPARIWDGEKPCTMRPWALEWLTGFAVELRRHENVPGVNTRWEYNRLLPKELQKWTYWLPWADLPSDFFGRETQSLTSWLKDPHVDPWRLQEGCRDISVPNLDIVGWYDYANGDMLLFRTMVKDAKTEVARKGSRLIIGPWSHNNTHRSYGNIDFGPNAALDRDAVKIRWFDYWLKGKQNGVEKDSPVRIFVMGDNAWRDELHWPLQRTQDKSLFIDSAGSANTPHGNGRLLVERPGSASIDTYIYDPADPVPSPTGYRFPIPIDQRSLADRKDILVYQTEALEERLEVTGNPVVELYASSEAPDTDWFVRLIDVAPDGLARNVSFGMVRVRYRNGFEKSELVRPGEVIKYAIRMDPTSNAFLPGHRIRLDITSSDFPRFDRNHNTAADQNCDAVLAAARQTIYHGAEHATRIILPWVPNPETTGKPLAERSVGTGEASRSQLSAYPLHQAVAEGDIEKIKRLLSEGADIDLLDWQESTPLCSAVKAGKAEAVRFLVEKGADVNAGSRPPLYAAVDANDITTASYLIDHGARVDLPSKWTPLDQAPYSSSV